MGKVLPYTEEQDNRIRELYPKGELDLLVKELGRSRYGIADRATKTLGVHMDPHFARLKHSKVIEEGNKSVNVHYFDGEWTSSMAWLIGYTWADGSLVMADRKIKYECHPRDRDLLSIVKQELRSTHTVSEQPGKGTKGPSVSVQVSSSRLVQGIKTKVPICSRKSELDLPLPEVPADFFPHFLRGYLDGDGWIVKGAYVGIGFCGGLRFIQGLQERLVSLLGLSRNKVSTNASVWDVSWSSLEEVRRLAAFLYPEGDHISGVRKRTLLAMGLSRRIA